MDRWMEWIIICKYLFYYVCTVFSVNTCRNRLHHTLQLANSKFVLFNCVNRVRNIVNCIHVFNFPFHSLDKYVTVLLVETFYISVVTVAEANTLQEIKRVTRRIMLRVESYSVLVLYNFILIRSSCFSV